MPRNMLSTFGKESDGHFSRPQASMMETEILTEGLESQDERDCLKCLAI